MLTYILQVLFKQNGEAYDFILHSIKIFENTKGVIRSVNQRRAYNTMDKRKGQTMIYRTLHRKTQTPLLTVGELRCYGMVSSFCSTSGTYCDTVKQHHVTLTLCWTPWVI